MKKILCGTDFSDAAAAALRVASQLAQTYGAELILYHAVTLPRDLPPKAFKLTPAELEQELVADQLENLKKLSAQVPADVKVVHRVEVHQPWKGLLAAGDEAEVDLIVIGAHGPHGIERVLGTTARAVAENTTRPVLIVPKENA